MCPRPKSQRKKGNKRSKGKKFKYHFRGFLRASEMMESSEIATTQATATDTLVGRMWMQKKVL